MPKTIWGKISLGVLAALVLQAILIVVMFYGNAFGAMVRFIQITPYTAALGLGIGIIGILREKDKGKSVPIATLSLSVIYIAFFFLILFGYQFGG